MGVGDQDTPGEALRAESMTRNVVSDMFSQVDLKVPEEGQNWGRPADKSSLNDLILKQAQQCVQRP